MRDETKDSIVNQTPKRRKDLFDKMAYINQILNNFARKFQEKFWK